MSEEEIKDKEKKRRKSKRTVISKENGLMTGLRKLRKVGDTYYVGVPKEFVEHHKLKEGDSVPFMANHLLKYVPMKEEQ